MLSPFCVIYADDVQITHATIFLLSMSNPICLFIRASCKKGYCGPLPVGPRKIKYLGRTIRPRAITLSGDSGCIVYLR